MTILSFSFYLSSSILPPAGGHTLDCAPFTGLCMYLCVWPSYIFFFKFFTKACTKPYKSWHNDIYLIYVSPCPPLRCMALVHDNCLIPTIDEPGLGYVRESLSNQYVPDVFYKVATKHELYGDKA